MVYFECQKCNETVKKPKLQKHLEFCGSYYVSCIDCHKVFDWESWEAHTSCVSEAQKYQGKLYDAKENSNKGQVKQDTWVDNIEKKIEDPNADISQQTRTLLQKLLGLSNIPRKQKPFGNFVKNSLKIWDEKKIGEMWEVVASANAKPPALAPTPAAAPKAEEGGKKDGELARKQQWAGWKRALDDELEAHMGELPWQKLRDALVLRYRASGEANGPSEERLQCLALSEIPEAYLSSEDSLVRLAKKAKMQG